ncbi:molybdenum cofactor biosynthesis protein MoaE [Hyphobacterium sp.]|uniref:molybdenum cofactor biosynthesis protein MoaE n=1 Tax=Hyphobacterium sp. TaxID=2004662 RepID=UPI003BACAC06
MPRPVIHLSGDALDLAGLNAQLNVGTDLGAVASFTGHVRGGGALNALELVHHPTLTAPALKRIAETTMSRFGLSDLLVAHRYGRMPPGEPVVHIVAGAEHRRAALDGVAFAIDVLKTQAPFWKREWRGDSSVWIEPTADDHSNAEKWLGESK